MKEFISFIIPDFTLVLLSATFGTSNLVPFVPFEPFVWFPLVLLPFVFSFLVVLKTTVGVSIKGSVFIFTSFITFGISILLFSLLTKVIDTDETDGTVLTGSSIAICVGETTIVVVVVDPDVVVEIKLDCDGGESSIFSDNKNFFWFCGFIAIFFGSEFDPFNQSFLTIPGSLVL